MSALIVIALLNNVASAAPASLRGAAGVDEAVATQDKQLKLKLRWENHPEKCLDVKDHANYNGNVVQLWDCFEYDEDQYWLIDGDALSYKIRWASHPEKCLDVKDHNSQNGARIQIWDCEEGDNDQLFFMGSVKYSRQGTLEWANHGKCIDVKDHRDSDGSVIQIWDCIAGDTDQNWVMDVCDACATEESSFEMLDGDNESQSEYESDDYRLNIQSIGHDVFKFKLRWENHPEKCLDVKDHENYNGNVVQLWDCFEYDDDQYWMIDGDALSYKIRWASNPDKCLDVKDHNSQNGARIQIWDCEDGDNDQLFFMGSVKYSRQGTLEWANHGKCIDVKDHIDSDGSVIQIWDCIDDDTDQNWVMKA